MDKLEKPIDKNHCPTCGSIFIELINVISSEHKGYWNCKNCNVIFQKKRS